MITAETIKHDYFCDKLADLEAETSSIASLLYLVANTFDETDKRNYLAIDSICAIAAHVGHISSELGHLFLEV